MKLLGFDLGLPESFPLSESIWGAFLLNLFGWILLAVVVGAVLRFLIRNLARRTRRVLDDAIMTIVYRPLVVLVLAYGMLHSWQVAAGPTAVSEQAVRLYRAVLIVLAAYVGWRVLYEIVIAYLAPIVQQSDSRADDIVVPILRRIGPVVIIVAVANAVVAALGGSLNTLLASLGLLGLVLGYLFQEPLQGLFSGTYMALDNPFREHDLIMLDDGTTCEVRTVGVRVTQLYDVQRHVLVYMPNARLASNRIINLTKPSIEMRSTLPITLPRGGDPIHPGNCHEGAALLVEACNAHPNILGNWGDQAPAIRRRIADYEAELAALPPDNDTLATTKRREWLRRMIMRLPGELVRLDVEHDLREHAEQFSLAILDLVHNYSRLADRGLNMEERREVKRQMEALIDRYDALIRELTVWLYLVRILDSGLAEREHTDTIASILKGGLMVDGELSLKELIALDPPYAPQEPMVTRDELKQIRSSEVETEKAIDRRIFEDRASFEDHKRLYNIWHRNITFVYRRLMDICAFDDLPVEKQVRLSEEIREIEKYLADSFLLRVSAWQMPHAHVVEIGDATTKYELVYFVDDIVREHFERDRRVRSELLQEIERLQTQRVAELVASQRSETSP